MEYENRIPETERQTQEAASIQEAEEILGLTIIDAETQTTGQVLEISSIEPGVKTSYLGEIRDNLGDRIRQARIEEERRSIKEGISQDAYLLSVKRSATEALKELNITMHQAICKTEGCPLEGYPVATQDLSHLVSQDSLDQHNYGEPFNEPVIGPCVCCRKYDREIVSE